MRAVATSAQRTTPAQDWPQLGRDAQRSNYSPLQVNPPCYIWKWYEVPFASRAQPVVAGGRPFIDGLDGVLYARHASTGTSLWTFAGDGSAIRHSAGVLSDTVVFSTYDGNTFALNAATGALLWQRFTGCSATAPLMDAACHRVVVAATDGRLTALNLTTGAVVWQYQSNVPVLTIPALSRDGSLSVSQCMAVRPYRVPFKNGQNIRSHTASTPLGRHGTSFSSSLLQYLGMDRKYKPTNIFRIRKP
ncbi:outer membrane protein assembly factor BamB family protein [Chloroflexus sp.]|uniref:outer membrane protein assembly factor BamB family protein n=1 Tax=Chloroflexus sp. TaxID=1904827 RepID=UPI00404ADBD4